MYKTVLASSDLGEYTTDTHKSDFKVPLYLMLSNINIMSLNVFRIYNWGMNLMLDKLNHLPIQNVIHILRLEVPHNISLTKINIVTIYCSELNLLISISLWKYYNAGMKYNITQLVFSTFRCYLLSNYWQQVGVGKIKYLALWAESTEGTRKLRCLCMSTWNL